MGQQVLLTVSDNGPGIPEGLREAVFQAFGRANTTPGRTESIGLGLTVSRYLADAMGGTLVYERVGGESQFTLSMPRMAQAARSNAPR